MVSAQLLETIEGKLRRLPDDTLREIAHFVEFMGNSPDCEHHEI